MATYEFIIKNETDAGGSGSPTAPTSAPTTNPKNSSNPSFKPVVKKAVAAYGIAKSFADTVATHQHNMISLRTGQEEYQQKVQFTYGHVKAMAGFIENVAVGFMLGNGVGAVVAAATSATMLGVQYLQKAEELSISRTVENVSIDMANIRAGSMNDRQGRNY